MFKQKTNKKIYKFFLPTLVVFSPFLTHKASAFSVNTFLGFIKNASATDSQKTTQNENLQSLKVFEPKKIFAQSSDQVVDTQNVNLKEKENSFEVDQGLVDATDTENFENHTENAIYTVQKNDSIYSIASYFGVSVQTILTFNHISAKDVHAGDVLEVPSVSGVLYEIKKGDTLNSIAKKYNVDVDDITLYNGLLASEDLSPEDEIFLPGAKENEVVKVINKIKKTTNNLAKTTSVKGRQWANGDTSHLNTSSDIAKYSSLPKYPGYYLLPVSGATRTQKMHGHNGVDLSSRIGTPVMASADGVVRVSKNSGYNFGFGNYIIIAHSNGTETVYGHLLHADVTPGQVVSRGQKIGSLGSTGNSTGPHLHFEVRGAYNPFAW